MGMGIRADVKVDPDGTCPVAKAATGAGSDCHSVNRSVNPTDPPHTSVEFVLNDGKSNTSVVESASVDVTPVFDYGDSTVYRYESETALECPCAVVESFDCPIVDQHVRDGAVFLTFHVRDIEDLQELIGELRDGFPGLDIQRLLRSKGEGNDHDLVFVDRSVLTDRQREALVLAHRRGYFEHPKRANAEEVAAEMGVSRPTFSEHLAAAQSKLFDAVIDQ